TAGREETWSKNNPQGRWRRFDLRSLLARDRTSLDLAWIQSSAAIDRATYDPSELAARITNDLQIAVRQFRKVRRRIAK
ncbi:MAG: SAM-dependent DNA methyltransferase, partial [Fimbriimonadaceae bacterium]